MEQHISITIVDTQGSLSDMSGSDELSGNISELKTLCPQDLHISVSEDKIIILHDDIRSLIIDDNILSHIEVAVFNLLPNSKLYHFVENHAEDLVGYSIFENGVKLRAKCIANGNIVVDDDNLTVYELGILQTMKDAILQAFANNADEINAAIDGKSQKDELKYFLSFRSQIVKDNITYENGKFEHEFIHKALPKLVESGIEGIMKLKTVRYEGVHIADVNLGDYISDAYHKLN